MGVAAHMAPFYHKPNCVICLTPKTVRLIDVSTSVMTAIDIVAGRFPFGVCVLHLKGKQIGIIYIYLASERMADYCRIFKKKMVPISFFHAMGIRILTPCCVSAGFMQKIK